MVTRCCSSQRRRSGYLIGAFWGVGFEDMDLGFRVRV